MLRIKADVNLNELEKFGFVKIIRWYDVWFEHVTTSLFVRTNDREIFMDNELEGSEEDILFDLIQAGLVEKVGDE